MKCYLKINTSFKITCQTSPDQAITPILGSRAALHSDSVAGQAGQAAADELPADHSRAEEPPVPWKSVLSPQPPHFPEQINTAAIKSFFWSSEQNILINTSLYCVWLKKKMFQMYFNTEAFVLLITPQIKSLYARKNAEDISNIPQSSMDHANNLN